MKFGHHIEHSGRRSFLKLLGGLAAIPSAAVGAAPSESRAEQCFRLRSTAAAYKLSHREAAHPTNGDEQIYANGEASYSKGLPHDLVGLPAQRSFRRLTAALSEGTFAALESVPVGGALKFANPMAQNAFDMEGLDSRQFAIPAPPAFSGAEQAGEMAELYWQALVRDVPFSRWDRDATICAAVTDLKAPKLSPAKDQNLGLTPHNLFRIPSSGVSDGPYVSQFLLRPVPYGDMLMEQRYFSAAPNQAFGATFPEFLAIENGEKPTSQTVLESSQRYLSTPRGLAEYVHRDYTFQAYLCAALILDSFGRDALSETNPYKWSKTQAGFVTFGAAHVIDSMARAANVALKAAWFQKWLVHRRIRPEEYAARVHASLTGVAKFPIPASLLEASCLSVTHFANGRYLLPQAYPEGCPAHPAYPAGHAAIAGACVTMLKAFFQETYLIPNPVVTDPNGTVLLSHQGPLTVGGELNKLASNMAMARNFAGVHWRSDSTEGIRLGEAVAIGVLRDQVRTLPETGAGFSFTSFEGGEVIIS